jgi:hypothetical protein
MQRERKAETRELTTQASVCCHGSRREVGVPVTELSALSARDMRE